MERGQRVRFVRKAVAEWVLPRPVRTESSAPAVTHWLRRRLSGEESERHWMACVRDILALGMRCNPKEDGHGSGVEGQVDCGYGRRCGDWSGDFAGLPGGGCAGGGSGEA